MKKTIIAAIAVLGMAVASTGGTVPTPTTAPNEINGEAFRQGFRDGYCAGWKEIKGQWAACPYVPAAPYPPYGKDNYKGGFTEGFKKGMADASRY